ncbi:DUF429 domain-containing protein [Nocardioides sp. R-C-SC26]|uniref:DUF429 domain-containing protein n=1 Tax=Nocardioides sp. R-C-SC26 TaxID=2870414 RepID=UPI001E3BD113|nr:DUF429 domain-containing protein [Nocardioides sp. R-C-SC26]
MRYVGIDLAWGERNPTGLAVLDEDARLIHLSAVRTDDEIVAALSEHTAGDCVVGIDAPLIVRNQTGSRPAEKALSKDFRRFNAGTHPTNLNKPEFSEGSRGARVAARFDLPIDQPLQGRRRAVEVYPHAATVALFALPKVLRYKHKSGRDLELLREQLLILMGLVETLVVVDETWQVQRASVETAATKAALRHVEDQVDAVVCAYVAFLAATRPDDVTVYGDAETGQIVTPTLGRGVDRTAAAVRAYSEQHTELVLAGPQAVDLVRGLLDDAGINYLSVTGRTKSVASFAEKAVRTRDGVPLYTDPLREITDQLGVRVITYTTDDVAMVADLLADQVVVTLDRDLGRLTAREGRFGYASRHLLVGLDPARQGREEFDLLPGRTVSVQVRTVLQHAWAEFEHDIRYKGSVPPEHASEFDRRFTLAAGLIELADREFSHIRDRLKGLAPTVADSDDDDPRLDPRELGAFLAGQFPDAAWSRGDHYGWISGLLLELGLTSFGEVADALARADHTAISSRMDYRHPPGAVRRVDDALLWVFGERYVRLHGNAHRRDALAARLERLAPAGEVGPR